MPSHSNSRLPRGNTHEKGTSHVPINTHVHTTTQVKQFFAQVELQSGRVALDQALERIRSNIFWIEHVEPQLRRWLHKD